MLENNSTNALHIRFKEQTTNVKKFSNQSEAYFLHSINDMIYSLFTNIAVESDQDWQ